MNTDAILRHESLRDLLIAHIAVQEGLIPAHIAAEICLTSWLRERGRPSIVPELIAEAGAFPAERVHWLNGEAERRISAHASAGNPAGTSLALARADQPAPREPARREQDVPIRTMAAGRYTDFQLRAQGGRGLVYDCWDRELARWVALKVLRPAGDDVDLDDPTRFDHPDGGQPHAGYQLEYDAFLREARRTGAMNHPSILPIHELGETPGGVPYFVMPRASGFTLRDAIAEGPPRGFDGIRVLYRVADAVAHVHEEHDLCHLDLEPGNIMLGRFGEVWVIDWGEARRPGNWSSSTGCPARGTPGWTAPELLREYCNIQTTLDVYALGALLFFVLTSTVPFAGETALFAPRGGPDRRVLPPTEMIPAANQRLTDLCTQCLSTDPAQRPPNAREVALQLRIALAGRRHA